MHSKNPPLFNSFLILLFTAPFLFYLSACSPPAEEATIVTSVEEPAAIEDTEIPISTASDKARALYEEGAYLMDVGRGVQAREKFFAAMAEDPGFALAYAGLGDAYGHQKNGTTL